MAVAVAVTVPARTPVIVSVVPETVPLASPPDSEMANVRFVPEKWDERSIFRDSSTNNSWSGMGSPAPGSTFLTSTMNVCVASPALFDTVIVIVVVPG